MTIATMPFRELRRGKIATEGIVRLIDKKSKKSKGLFVPPALENEVLGFLAQMADSKKQERLKALESISGSMTGLIGDESFKELKGAYIEGKYGK